MQFRRHCLLAVGNSKLKPVSLSVDSTSYKHSPSNCRCSRVRISFERHIYHPKRQIILLGSSRPMAILRSLREWKITAFERLSCRGSLRHLYPRLSRLPHPKDCQLRRLVESQASESLETNAPYACLLTTLLR